MSAKFNRSQNEYLIWTGHQKNDFKKTWRHKEIID